MPYYVSKLNLINIRSYDNVEIDFSRSINLLVGNNNSGKSTVIKALYKLQSSHSLGIEDIRKTADYGRILIDLEDITTKEGITFEPHNKENPVKFPATDKVKVVFGVYDNLKETKRGQDSLFFDLNNSFQSDDTGKTKISDSENKEFLFLISAVYLILKHTIILFTLFSLKEKQVNIVINLGKERLIQ